MRFKYFVLVIILFSNLKHFSFAQTYITNGHLMYIHFNNSYNNGNVMSFSSCGIDSITYNVPIQIPITSNPGAGVTFDNFNYSSVILGNGQEWMVENLRTTTYSNGDPIPFVPANWHSVIPVQGAWTYYNNDIANNNVYGKLYNHYAVSDPRNVCPIGWHVPTNAEFTDLGNYLDSVSVAGGKMKSIGTQYWQSPNQNATNDIGFSGMPGGYILSEALYSGTFFDLGLKAYFWVTNFSSTYGYYFTLSHDSGLLNYNIVHRSSGLSVRCIKN